MNTETAKEIANHRHQVMESFVKEFLSEWFLYKNVFLSKHVFVVQELLTF